MRLWSMALVVACAAWSASSAAAQRTTTVGSDPGLARLAGEVERLAALSGGTMGVAAVHLETGREVYLNHADRFPMASSYKVPIAVQLLTRVERGEIRLDSMIAMEPADLHPGSGTLSELFDDPGVVLSLRNYLELMLLISDNSATDVVLRTA
ncbi:MAG: serine hydrolase, partial [Longimicrobiales bacterium]